MRVVLIIGLALTLFLIGRLINITDANILNELEQQQSLKAMMILVATALVVITFFLVGSIWGTRTAWHGLGIGVLFFLGAYGLSTGWRAAVAQADDPRELWRVDPATDNLELISKTLQEASLRANGTRWDMEIIVQIPTETSDDKPIDWMLRRFRNVRYVVGVAPTTNAPAIITPFMKDPPALGAQYVGQDFPLYSTWDINSMNIFDTLSWLFDGQSRVPPTIMERRILWVRSDVYGLASDSLPTLPQ
jgi:hypothetical protein